jgi:uncharacterized membrane protein YphA (DoxX/SURF4 family)
MSNSIQWLQHIARVGLGLVFLVFGLNFFFGFLPAPPPPPEAAAQFLGGLMAAGYLMPLVKIIEIGAALMLLTNRFVPLALILLAPIVVNIVGFHAVLAPALGLPLVILAMGLFLAFTHRSAYAELFRARSGQPSERRPVSSPVHPAARAV